MNTTASSQTGRDMVRYAAHRREPLGSGRDIPLQGLVGPGAEVLEPKSVARHRCARFPLAENGDVDRVLERQHRACQVDAGMAAAAAPLRTRGQERGTKIGSGLGAGR